MIGAPAAGLPLFDLVVSIFGVRWSHGVRLGRKGFVIVSFAAEGFEPGEQSAIAAGPAMTFSAIHMPETTDLVPCFN